MNSDIYVLIAAALGSVSGTAAVIVTNRHQRKQDDHRFALSQYIEAQDRLISYWAETREVLKAVWPSKGSRGRQETPDDLMTAWFDAEVPAIAAFARVRDNALSEELHQFIESVAKFYEIQDYHSYDAEHIKHAERFVELQQKLGKAARELR